MLNNQQNKKTVLITGAAGGICVGINSALGEAGFNLICADLPGEKLENEVARIRELGATATSLPIDLASDTSISQAIGVLENSGVAVDALVNAAGVLDRKFMKDLEVKDFENALQINVVAPYNLIKRLAPAMVSQGWGRIINISSIAGRNGYPFPSYAASKAALSNLTRSLVNDLWGTGITINNISPGLVNTPMAEPTLIKQATWRVPTGHAIEPREIGELCRFLLSDAATNINGADLVIDGGITSYFQIRGRLEGPIPVDIEPDSEFDNI